MPHVTVHEISVDEIWLEFGRKTMLKRVCTRMSDRSVTCLERKELEEAIIILRRVGVKWFNESGKMLLSNANRDLPEYTGSKWNSTSSR
jgi:hypothetical protein